MKYQQNEMSYTECSNIQNIPYEPFLTNYHVDMYSRAGLHRIKYVQRTNHIFDFASLNISYISISNDAFANHPLTPIGVGLKLNNLNTTPCLLTHYHVSGYRYTLSLSSLWAKWGDIPDSKVHGANLGPTWVLSDPDGPYVDPMNLAIRDF